MDAKFWDDRYGAHASVYGMAPNAFLKENLVGMRPGTALFPAEGEGRNALFAASLGWKVFAFDQSKVAQEKALAAAARAGLRIEYEVIGLEHFPEVHFPEGYDLIGLFYVHMPSTLRKVFHARMLKNLAPGGTLILECFSPTNWNIPREDPRILICCTPWTRPWRIFPPCRTFRFPNRRSYLTKVNSTRVLPP